MHPPKECLMVCTLGENVVEASEALVLILTLLHVLCNLGII